MRNGHTPAGRPLSMVSQITDLYSALTLPNKTEVGNLFFTSDAHKTATVGTLRLVQGEWSGICEGAGNGASVTLFLDSSTCVARQATDFANWDEV